MKKKNHLFNLKVKNTYHLWNSFFTVWDHFWTQNSVRGFLRTNVTTVWHTPNCSQKINRSRSRSAIRSHKPQRQTHKWDFWHFFLSNIFGQIFQFKILWKNVQRFPVRIFLTQVRKFYIELFDLSAVNCTPFFW